jgi:hypothetical protein
VGLRPTVGLVPGYGIAPISASQDTAGPMVRTVSDAAAAAADDVGVRSGERGRYYAGIWGPGCERRRHRSAVASTSCPTICPHWTSTSSRQAIGYNGTLTDGSPLKLAYDALTQAGAIMSSATVSARPACPAAC